MRPRSSNITMRFIAVFFLAHFLSYVQSATQICTTEACFLAAERIKENMNPAIDPCTDFYEYSCGRYKGGIKKWDGTTHFDQYHENQDEVEEILLKTLRKATEELDDIDSLRQKFGAFFKSCKNYEIKKKEKKEEDAEEVCKERMKMKLEKETNHYNFGPLLSRYFEVYASNDTKDTYYDGVDIMFKSVKRAAVQMIDELVWMSAEAKVLAKDRLQSVRQFGMIPDKFLDIRKLQRIYGSMDLEESADDYISNLNEMTRKTQIRDADLDEEVVLYNKRILTEMEYNDVQHAVFVSEGFMRGIYFNESVPSYLNYGASGSFYGHELFHMFDTSQHRNISEDWDQKTLEQYKMRTGCVSEQFSKYRDTQTQLNLNGSRTLDENMCDIGGVQAAFRAYRSSDKDEIDRMKLIGLEELKPEELFWIAAAQTECALVPTSNLKQKIKTDKYSIPRYRVNGAFAGLPGFNKVFNCNVNSAMNPELNCHLWS